MSHEPKFYAPHQTISSSFEVKLDTDTHKKLLELCGVMASEEVVTLYFEDGPLVVFKNRRGEPVEKNVPATRWQNFKLHWFPKWLKYLFPVKYVKELTVPMLILGATNAKNNQEINF